jgi:hypothetical protein
MAHARISNSSADGEETAVCISGDLAGFDSRDDAIVCARNWALTWLQLRFPR